MSTRTIGVDGLRIRVIDARPSAERDDPVLVWRPERVRSLTLVAAFLPFLESAAPRSVPLEAAAS